VDGKPALMMVLIFIVDLLPLLVSLPLRFTFTLAFVCYLLLPAFTLVLVFMASSFPG
jgi:hypothetical protein